MLTWLEELESCVETSVSTTLASSENPMYDMSRLEKPFVVRGPNIEGLAWFGICGLFEEMAKCPGFRQ
jgi:hypothetical protein